MMTKLSLSQLYYILYNYRNYHNVQSPILIQVGIKNNVCMIALINTFTRDEKHTVYSCMDGLF